MRAPEQTTLKQAIDGHITLVEGIMYLGLMAIGFAVGFFIYHKYLQRHDKS